MKYLVISSRGRQVRRVFNNICEARRAKWAMQSATGNIYQILPTIVKELPKEKLKPIYKPLWIV